MTSQEQREKWRTLNAGLNQNVLGQSEALEMVTTAVLAGEMGYVTEDRPKTFGILLGPTGTGKTAALLAASRHLYGTAAILRLNMAEYPERKDLARLLGEDRTDNGLLGREIERISALGGRIILIDEIEKAHKDISNVFLGMEAAELTLANRQKLDLRPFHIFCTTNLGTADTIEMQTANLAYGILAEHIEQEAMTHFLPEVWARFTHKIIYRPLPYQIQIQVCQKMLAEELIRQAAVTGFPITAGDGVFRFLLNKGFHETLGARPLRNAIEFYVRQALVKADLAGMHPNRPGILRLKGERFALEQTELLAA